MSVAVLYMSMSLDGYIAYPNDHLGGDDGNRLHQWALTPDGESFRSSGAAGHFIEEINATGAVLVGRRTRCSRPSTPPCGRRSVRLRA